MIPGLSFVPLSDVESAFSKVTDEICVTADEFDIPTEILEKIDELATHFPNIYIKEETIGRQQRDFLDPPALWNHYNNAAAGLNRTTNGVEGWHYGVTSLFQGSHPSIHTFQEKIQLDLMKKSG